MSGPILTVENLSAGYGGETIVDDVSLAFMPATITTLIGANGAGKSTLLKAIYGTVTTYAGRVLLEGTALQDLPPAQRLRQGLGFVPQGRCNFPLMTVGENLQLGTYTLARDEGRRAIDKVTALFPVLGDKLRVAAGNLSGGEQQLLEMAMVLMTRPKVMLLDEPSIGLSPINLALVLRTIVAIRETGTTIVMVEQNVKGALAISDRAVVMQLGRIVADGLPSQIRESGVLAGAML